MDEFSYRTETVERCITKMMRIKPDDYMELWYETACEFAEQIAPIYCESPERIKDLAYMLKTNKAYMYFWARRWVDACEHFIEWHYANKSIEDLKKMVLQSRKPSPIVLMKIKQTSNL